MQLATWARLRLIACKAGDEEHRRGWWLWLSLPILLAVYIAIAWYMDRYFLGVDWRAYLSLSRLAMNALPGILCIVLLTALSRRILLPTVVVTLLHVFLLFVSKLKLVNLREPLAFHDLYFLTNLDRSSLVLFATYLEHKGWAVTLLLAVVSVAGVLWWLERPRSKVVVGPMLLGRVLVALASTVLLWGLCVGSAPWSKLYSRQNVRPVAWDAKVAVLRSGLIGSLAHQVVASSEFKLTSDPVLLEYVMRATEERSGSTEDAHVLLNQDELPNVVLILSESFMDPNVVAGMDEVAEVIPMVRQLLEMGDGDLMRVPTYGGGTIKTEFEVLTGMPLEAFPGINFPYFTLAARRRIPALPSILQRYGYRSIAIHGNSPAFWNRSSIFRTMGFQDFFARTEFKEEGIKDGRWYSDESMTDLVLREARASTQPAFIFAISMENHGPYSGEQDVSDRGRWNSIELPAGVVSDGPELELRNYFYHLGNADRELARLISELGKEKRPYLVVFFGDHLPAFSEAYGEVDFVDGQAPDRQRVPWVIARDPRMQHRDLSEVTESWQLPVAIFDAVGLDGGDYLRLSRDAMRLSRSEKDRRVAKKLLDGLHSAANRHLERGLENDKH